VPVRLQAADDAEEVEMRLSPAVILMVTLVSPATAGTGHAWLGGHASYATYSMSDVNSDIGDINAAIAGTGLTMREIHGGFGFGALFGFDVSDRFSLGLGYDHLTGSSDVGDPSGSIKYDFPANAFRVFGQYSFTGMSTSGAYLGAAGGFIRETGSVSVSVTGQGSASADIKGSSGLFEVFLGGDWWAAPQVALTGSGGYRYAKISEAKVNDNIIYLPSGQKESIDYSGLVLRAGIKFALPAHSE
jgi:hypothetical protein